MQVVKTSRRGIDYLAATLRDGPRSSTEALFWRIPHHDSSRDEVQLKIGRYKKDAGSKEVEHRTPKSELTLDGAEFRNLLDFLKDNYEPFRSRESRWLSVDDELSHGEIEVLQRLFARGDSWEVVDFVLQNGLVTNNKDSALQHRIREAAVAEFRDMLDGDLLEHNWQAWFTVNDWILGSDIVRVIDERSIDTDNIAGYLVEGHDGFLDIIEIKRPEGGLKFWSDTRDHGNLVPSTDLIKAITQTSNYLFQIEMEANSVKFVNRLGVPAVKPRTTLVYGRSFQWDEQHRMAYRILNRSFHDLTILTYDHVLARAERSLGRQQPTTT